jgi:hypothetical protein
MWPLWLFSAAAASETRSRPPIGADMTQRIPESFSSWPAVANMIPPRDPNDDDDENEDEDGDEAEDEEPAVIREPDE